MLDTSVLIHDPSALFKFKEHDVVLPMSSIEELDNNKKGTSDVARNTRQTLRFLDEITEKTDEVQMIDGFSVYPLVTKEFQSCGMLYIETQHMPIVIPRGLAPEKVDNQILALAMYIKGIRGQREVLLVSKDRSLRIKARAHNLPAQDYQNDAVVDDAELLPTGIHELKEGFWKRVGAQLVSTRTNGRAVYKIPAKHGRKWHTNDFVSIAGAKPFDARVQSIADGWIEFSEVDNRCALKNAVMGIAARNREQNFALNLLNDTGVDFITLLGKAGSGKTLLTLASAFDQIIRGEIYSEIIFTRVTVPVGEDIGYLPGTEKEKMDPWMGAFYDNIDVINQALKDAKETDFLSEEILKKIVKIKSPSFMRGRTLLNKFLIIDEAQNLTPKQMKTLLTRAGPGTKVVCLGNLAQIDTPYINPENSGLTHAVTCFQNYPEGGNIRLQEGERSRLAKHAEEQM